MFPFVVLNITSLFGPIKVRRVDCLRGEIWGGLLELQVPHLPRARVQLAAEAGGPELTALSSGCVLCPPVVLSGFMHNLDYLVAPLVFLVGGCGFSFHDGFC